MEYYSAIKNEGLMQATTRMNFKVVMLVEISQTRQKKKRKKNTPKKGFMDDLINIKFQKIQTNLQ